MFFFLYGEDSYSSNEKLRQIKEKFIRDIDVSGYNIVVLDEKITIEKLSKELCQSGFLSSKKLVIIKNLLASKITKDLAPFLIDFLDKNNSKDATQDEDNIVVFYEDRLPHSSKNALTGENLKVFKKLDEFKYKQEFKKMTDAKIVVWIKKRFKELGADISDKYANELLGRSGSDLYLLNTEIQKIANYSKGRVIDEAIIKDLVLSGVDDNIFLISEKIANKDNKGALRLIKSQIDSGENAQYLLTMFIRQFRILLQVKSAVDEEKVSINNLRKYLSLHPFVVKKSLDSARLYSLSELKQIYKKLLELDLASKSSKLDVYTLMSIFLLNMEK